MATTEELLKTPDTSTAHEVCVSLLNRIKELEADLDNTKTAFNERLKALENNVARLILKIEGGPPV